MDPEVKSVQFDSSLSGRERMEVRNQFQTLTFPVQSVPGLLSPVLYCGTELADRGQVHEMCERLGLGHESEGQGKERRLRVWVQSVEARLASMEKALRVTLHPTPYTLHPRPQALDPRP
eukprot:1552327-Rhodomonas_salina.2